MIDRRLLEEMFNGTEVYYDRHDAYVEDIEFEDYFEDYDFYKENYSNDPRITTMIFNDTKEYLVELLMRPKYYYSEDMNSHLLELHDIRVLHDVYNESFDEGVYDILISEALDRFAAQTGVEAYLCGRSGRHVCVDITIDNLIDYTKLQKVAVGLSQWFIDEANAWGVYDD